MRGIKRSLVSLILLGVIFTNNINVLATSYEYDELGRMVTATYNEEEENKDEASYTYDASGNITSVSGFKGESTGGKVSYVWNYTNNENTDSFFTVSANSWSKAIPVNYNDQTLTKAIKMESSTSIVFSAPEKGTLRLYTYATNLNAYITINGENYEVSQNGETVISGFDLGDYEVLKGTTNTFIYYMCFETDDGNLTTETTTETTTEIATETTTEAVTEVQTAYIWTLKDQDAFFEVTANEWSNAVSINYGNETIDRAIKMESNTSIKFHAQTSGELILYTYATNTNPTIKLNGINYNASTNGEIIIDIASPGDYELIRGSTNTYIYYMCFAPYLGTPPSKTWDFSDDQGLSGLGTINNQINIRGLTLLPTTTNRIEVVPSQKNIDGRTYKNYLAIKEPGSITKNGIKLHVPGDCFIYITGVTSQSEAIKENRVLQIYKDGNTTTPVGNMVFTKDGNTEKFEYLGEATDLYLYTEIGRVNIYTMSIAKRIVDDSTISKVWNMGDDNFKDLGRLESPIVVDGLTLNALEDIDSGTDRDMEVRYHYDDDPYGIEYTHELNLEGKGCVKFRSVGFYVPKNTNVYITTQYNTLSSNINYKLIVADEFGYVLDNTITGHSNDPETTVFKYTGVGENLYLYTSDKIAIRQIELETMPGDLFTSSSKNIWDFSDFTFANASSGDTVFGLTMNGQIVSIAADGPYPYTRYVQIASGNFNYNNVNFEVDGSCRIIIDAQSNSNTENRQLVVVDKHGCLVDTVTVTPKGSNTYIDYTGEKNQLYILSPDSYIRIYGVATTQKS